MNRRTFLQVIATAIAAAVINPKPTSAQNTTRPAWDLLPSHPCREIVSQASNASLLEWWTTYGMGTVAWQYRDVPRRHILHVLNQRHITPYEHPGR